MSDDHIHEEQEPQPRPTVVYKAVYWDKKGHAITINDVHGFQFEVQIGVYFLYIPHEGMPVPKIQSVNIMSPDVKDFQLIPVEVIEPNG